MTSAAISQQNFRDIGIAVYKMQPNLAQNLLKRVKEVSPACTDLDLIPSMFKKYCQHRECNYCPKSKKDIYLRHVFIAAIIKLYNPELFTGIHTIKMRHRLREGLADVLRVDPRWVSQNIPTIIVRLDVYTDFNNDVTSAVEVLQWK